MKRIPNTLKNHSIKIREELTSKIGNKDKLLNSIKIDQDPLQKNLLQEMSLQRNHCLVKMSIGI